MTNNSTMTPAQAVPHPRFPLGSVTPFTYRDGWTYLEILENFRVWIRDELVPLVNDNADQMDAAYAAALSTFLEAVNDFNDFKVETGNTLTEIQDAAQAVQDIFDELQTTGPVVSVNDKHGAVILTGEEFTRSGNLPVGQGEITVNVRDYGATGDGTSDDTSAVHGAIAAAAGGTLYFPAGRYSLTENFNVPRDTFILGAGAGQTVLDFRAKPEFSGGATLGYFMWEPGTIVDRQPLAQDVAAGVGGIPVANIYPFKAGDFVRITSDEVVYDQAVKAELHRVQEIVGNVVHFGTSTYDSYLVSDGAELQLLDMPTGGISDLTIQGKGLNPASLIDDGPEINRGDSGLIFAFYRDVRISNVKFVGVENRCMRLASTFGARVENCEFTFHTARVRLKYGVSINGASQHTAVTGCSSYNDRHMVTTSTSSSTDEGYQAQRGIPRFITVSNCTGYGSWQDSIDTHLGGDYLTIIGNTLTSEVNGIKIRGAHVEIIGNIINGKRDDDSPFNSVRAGVSINERCTNITVANNIIRGFSHGVITRFINPAGTSGIIIQGNTIFDVSVGVNLATSDGARDVTINGNNITVNDVDGMCVRVDRAGGRGINITGNTLNNGRIAIRMVGTSESLVTGNRIVGQSFQAMFIQDVEEILLTGNFIRMIQEESSSGIRIMGTLHSVTVDRNMVIHPTRPMHVDLDEGSTDVRIGNNTPSATPQLPAANEVTAGEIREALMELGLIQ